MANVTTTQDRMNLAAVLAALTLPPLSACSSKGSFTPVDPTPEINVSVTRSPQVPGAFSPEVLQIIVDGEVATSIDHFVGPDFETSGTRYYPYTPYAVSLFSLAGNYSSVLTLPNNDLREVSFDVERDSGTTLERTVGSQVLGKGPSTYELKDAAGTPVLDWELRVFAFDLLTHQLDERFFVQNGQPTISLAATNGQVTFDRTQVEAQPNDIQLFLQGRSTSDPDNTSSCVFAPIYLPVEVSGSVLAVDSGTGSLQKQQGTPFAIRIAGANLGGELRIGKIDPVTLQPLAPTLSVPVPSGSSHEQSVNVLIPVEPSLAKETLWYLDMTLNSSVAGSVTYPYSFFQVRP